MANMTDYERERAAFALEVPETFNFGFDVVDKWAADPEKLAMLWVDDACHSARYTFADMRRESNRFASVLQGLGLRKGDGVMLVLPRVPQWHTVMVGLMKLGAIPMPGTVLLTPKDYEYRINLAEARAVIVDSANAAKVEAIRANCPTLEYGIVLGGPRPGWIDYDTAMATASETFAAVTTYSDDPALLYFTSGTTGGPKMVLHTQASYPLAHLLTGKYWLDLGPDDLHWNLSDTGWAKAAYSNLFGPWRMGTAVFIQHSSGRFDAQTTLRLLAQHGVTTFCAPPTAYRMLVLEDLQRYDLSKLRHCIGAGEPLNPEVIAAWKAGTGLTIYDGYGQTETVILVANYPCLPVKPGSMGKPLPGFDVAIIDANSGTVLPPGQEGDIAVRVQPQRPVGLFREYWKNPAETSHSFRGAWYITGDRGLCDADGYFWFVGRADDVIISAGYRIGPFEVESALIEHPAVAESAVVASPDEMRGALVKAFVVLAPGYQASPALATDLQEHVKQLTAPYKYPREIEFVTALPKTISGKIRRVELRQREIAQKAHGGQRTQAL
ncbi:MAG TPA: AMP-binding protein [Candidatus Tectomicrobia bacterium]|jgi:acetyl-CoA synthetase/medium-chain acyl-CoA synthetase